MAKQRNRHGSLGIVSIAFVVGLLFLASPRMATGQLCVAPTEGSNAVYGNCNSNITVTTSPAFVDAAAWCNGDCQIGADICQFIANAIGNLPAGVGGVVDGRGLVYPDGSAVTCAENPFPQSNTVPVTVFLPPAVIQTRKPWILPSNTRLIGQGRQTILRGLTVFSADSTNAMIEMGSSTLCPSTGCTGISVEYLKLDGNLITDSNGVGLTGIYNGYATDGSYVDHVNFSNIGAVSQSQTSLTTGLLIDTGAQGSGPYTNLDFPGDSSHLCSGFTCPATAAVQIRAATRGLHGITTTALTDKTTHFVSAGIYLDASNNTIEDVHNEGFYDAIVVGPNAAQGPNNVTVAGNTILNVTGDEGAKNNPTFNAVHICNPILGSQTGACNSKSYPVQDLALFQIESTGGSAGFAVTTVRDDVTGAIINSSASSSFVGQYVLGESIAASEYTRFTTAPKVASGSAAPSWGVGGTDVTNQSCATPGALYSCTSGGQGQNPNTLFVCNSNGGGSNTWIALK